MAVDKLVDSAQLDADLTSVANAIRTKGGTSAQLAFPQGFVDAVEAIETGGGGEPDWDDWASSTPMYNDITIGDIYPSRSYTWAGIPANIIRYELARNTNINGALRMFSGCLASIIVLAYFNGAFGSSSSYPFSECPRLKIVDCKLSGLSAQAFVSSNVFDTLIIRKTDGVCALPNINAFNNTPFASGKTGGTLYVPSALVSQYTQATNWSTILRYANNQILPIEGSVYENAYADGTPIS